MSLVLWNVLALKDIKLYDSIQNK